MGRFHTAGISARSPLVGPLALLDSRGSCSHQHSIRPHSCEALRFRLIPATRMPATSNSLTKSDLESCFHLPLSDAAKSLGVSQTFIKKMCRAHSITRWPFRKVQAQSRKRLRDAETPMGKSYIRRLSHLDHVCETTIEDTTGILREAFEAIEASRVVHTHVTPDLAPRASAAQVSPFVVQEMSSTLPTSSEFWSRSPAI